MTEATPGWRDPRHWPSYLGIGLIWLLARLPFETILKVGSAIGALLYHLVPARRRVAEINVALCLPELDAPEQRRIAHESFRHMGRAIGEMAVVWFGDLAAHAKRFELVQREHLDRAMAAGNGVILLQAHLSTIDICAHTMGTRWPISAVYDSPKNPVIAARLLAGREYWMRSMIDNRDIRQMVRRLRRGEIVWYSPDQTVHPRNGGIPTRYFGHPVLTSSGTARIVAMTGAAVVPYLPERLPGGRYRLSFSAPLELDIGDPEGATQAVNDHLESQVRRLPEQYLWVHKRFKPSGDLRHNPYR